MSSSAGADGLHSEGVAFRKRVENFFHEQLGRRRPGGNAERAQRSSDAQSTSLARWTNEA